MIIAVSSLKGGVGKTTIASFLAQALADEGHRVLVVDLDHNNNLTDYWLRFENWAYIEAKSVRQVLLGTLKLSDAIWPWPEAMPLKGVSVIGATPSLATVGAQIAHDPGVVLRFARDLARLDYDHIIIDTPPALTLELTLGLYAADLVLVPVSASRWTVQGYQIIEGEVAKVSEAIGKAPRMLAVPSMVTDIEAAGIRSAGIWKTTAATIRRDAPIRAAASEGRALRPGTLAAGWFEELAAEVVG